MRAMGGDLSLEFAGDGSSYFRLTLLRSAGPQVAAAPQAAVRS
jgi:hypothetical protein